VELAYLLSRAVERGFAPDWLLTADKMLNFAVAYSLHPEYGGMLYDTTDYEGLPLSGNPDNSQFTWWAQGETARALLHFAVVRGRDDFAERFITIQAHINDHLTDHEYGGWYHALDAANDLRPIGVEKGDVWKVNYHFSMYYAEVLRLADQYPDRVQTLSNQHEE
jgi:mannose/cellobiose epimerase-like protein (N-acyl-D-glucosamine 2-epimerase family)